MTGRRALLEHLRDRLIEEVGTAEGRDLAPLAKELRAVMTELESLPTGKGSTVDDLAQRRAARRAEAAG